MISYANDLLLTSPLDNDESDKTFVFGEFTFDPRFRRVTRGKHVIPLTLREYELLAALAARAGAPVSKNVLRGEVWHNTIPADSRSIDQHVAELRRKLRGDDTSASIMTTRKYGYSLCGAWVVRPTTQPG